MGRREALAERNHCSSQLELSLRFIRWADALGHVPRAEEIEREFQMHISNAYRWRNAYCDASGYEIPDARLPGERASQRKKARRQPAPVQTPIEGQ